MSYRLLFLCGLMFTTLIIYVYYVTEGDITNFRTFLIQSTDDSEIIDSVTYLLNRNTTNVTIFFIETSDVIKPRSLCAVESTARHNPNAEVILLVTKAPLILDELDLLKCRYHNFQVLRLNAAHLFQDTEFQDFYKSGKLNKSHYLIHHTSDILRTMVIWRFGGIYMDSDIIMFKPISHLRDFVVQEHDTSLANAELGFDRNNEVVHKFLVRQTSKFNGNEWASNGPAAFTDVINSLCGSVKVQKCKYVEVLPFDAFHALPYGAYYKLFDNQYMKELTNLWNNSYGLHFWNYMWKDENRDFIAIDSDSPISVVARKNCPMIYYNQKIKM